MKKINHKHLFLEAVKDKAKVKCAILSTEPKRFNSGPEQIKAILKIGWDEQDLRLFFKVLDEINYAHGYIWLYDGTWLSSEETWDNWWWEHIQAPQIPNELTKG